MTQKELILEYIKEHGSMLPAKCYGLVYKEQMLGSETSKRCRELRTAGVLKSQQEGKFERFYLQGGVVIQQHSAFKPVVDPVPFITAQDFLTRFPSQPVEQVKEVKNALW